jgi:hypothetical protein
MRRKKQSPGSKQRAVQSAPFGEPFRLPGGVPAERVFSNNYSPKFHDQIADVRVRLDRTFGRKD